MIFSSLAWLSRHHAMEEYAAYQLDSVRVGQEAKIRPSWLIGALLAAFLVGLGMALWVHLDTFYSIGSNMAGGGNGGLDLGTAGGWSSMAGSSFPLPPPGRTNEPYCRGDCRPNSLLG